MEKEWYVDWHTDTISQYPFVRTIDEIIVKDIRGNDTETVEARAALIAAAPKLLKALINLLRETNQHSEGDCPILREACNSAHFVIKEATRGKP